jgi:hypothetical protein
MPAQRGPFTDNGQIKTKPQTHLSMSHLLVYATAESRLHADLVVVRLKQAGIDTDLISVIHPAAARPNSALCWLNGMSSLPMTSGGSTSVSGLFRYALSDVSRNNGSSSLADRLSCLGLTHDQGMSIEESLMENRIIVLVEVHDEYDLPAIFHTFRGLAAEKVHTADLERRKSGTANGAGRYRPPLSSRIFAHAVAAA